MFHFLKLQQNDYWICINTNPWQHNFEEDNYLSIKKISIAQFTTMLNRESFIKVGKNFSLQHWDTAALLIEQSFKEMLSLLKN